MSSRLFVGNLSYDWTKEVLNDALNQVFGEFGEIEEIVIPINIETKKQKGIAFIQFKDEEGVNVSIKELNGAFFGPDGSDARNARELKLDVAKPRPPKEPRERRD